MKDNFCITSNSIHLSGLSNGGMFTYYAISELRYDLSFLSQILNFKTGKDFSEHKLIFSDIVATIGPVSAAPMLGFGEVPSSPVSLIDFHGINDDTIPYDLEHSVGKSKENIGVTKLTEKERKKDIRSDACRIIA